MRQVALRRHAGRGPLCVRSTRVPAPGWVCRRGIPLQHAAEVSRFSRGVGLETRPGPIHPTPGMDMAGLVCALASLSVWWRHGEWAPFPGYPLAWGSRRSPAAPPPPPPPPLELGSKVRAHHKHRGTSEIAETCDFTHKFGKSGSPPIFFGTGGTIRSGPSSLFSRPPPPLIPTGSKGPPPPEMQWTAALITHARTHARTDLVLRK